MSDLIKRHDAIKELSKAFADCEPCDKEEASDIAVTTIKELSSADRTNATEIMSAYHEGVRKGIAEAYEADGADRPRGDVDAVAIFEREMHNLEQGYITIGEFDERIEPLRHLCYGRPKGEWIDYRPYNIPLFDCSICGYHAKKMSNFCPNCGAHMKGKTDD